MIKKYIKWHPEGLNSCVEEIGHYGNFGKAAVKYSTGARWEIKKSNREYFSITYMPARKRDLERYNRLYLGFFGAFAEVLSDAEPESVYILELIEMEETEFAALPEFMGP